MNVRIGVMVASLLIGATTVGSAQAQVLAGLSFGGTYSDFENPDTESRWGFTGGLFMGVAARGTLSMLEVSYTQKGSADTRLDYIETGITGGAVVGNPGGARARAYGGITVAFPLSCESTSSIVNELCDEGGMKVEWGAPLGLMLGSWKGQGAFFGFDVRYTFPLSDAGAEIYNNTWMFRVILGKPTSRSR